MSNTVTLKAFYFCNRWITRTNYKHYTQSEKVGFVATYIKIIVSQSQFIIYITINTNTQWTTFQAMKFIINFSFLVENKRTPMHDEANDEAVQIHLCPKL